MKAVFALPLLNADTENAGDMQGGIAHEHNVRSSQISALEVCQSVCDPSRACAIHAIPRVYTCKRYSFHTQSQRQCQLRAVR